jgi:hypothetical protein
MTDARLPTAHRRRLSLLSVTSLVACGDPVERLVHLLCFGVEDSPPIDTLAPGTAGHTAFRGATSGCGRHCGSVWNKGSDSLSMQPTLRRRKKPSAEQVQLGAAVHLPFDEFELGDLTFGFAVGPGLGHGCGDRAAIGDDACAERRQDTTRGIGDPGGQTGRIALAHHFVEALDQIAGHHQWRHTSLDASDGDRIAFG